MVAPVGVRHAAGSYAVIVRGGARADLGALITERHPGARIAVITDSNVAIALGSALPAAQQFVFEAGEARKSRATWAGLTDQMLAARYDRDSVIVAFGGGVTTDLAGFVAATLFRGVPWIAVPTTTLAMLDAAIGGKTGVDTEAGKNLVGAFHPPSAVLCDPELLRSLPERSYREGIAEAVKHAAIADDRYGEWIASSIDPIGARDIAALESLIRRSVEIKADVVIDDEREGDRRAVLNAGHTVAHAIERATDYSVPHGEAVAIGLVLETRLAERMGIADSGTADRIAKLLASLQLPVDLPPVDRTRLHDAMLADKKNRRGLVHATLVKSFGTVARNGEGWTFPLDMNALNGLL